MPPIYSALVYYWDHQEEIERDLERRAQLAEELRREPSGRVRQPPVHHPPERGDGFGLAVEVVLKESDAVERRWIGITLVVFAELFHPVVRLAGIDDGEELARVEVGPSLVVQAPEIVRLDAKDEVGLARGQVRIL